MSDPRLSIIIPTIGRPSLLSLLTELRRQWPGDGLELLVIGDTHGGTWKRTLPAAQAACLAYRARYLPYDGGVHAWGQPQRTYGQSQAQGAWLWWLQDDDLPTPAALPTIRAQIATGPALPHLYRVLTWGGGLVWQDQRLTFGNIDADCLLAPNDPAYLAEWPNTYAGDFVMIRDTVALYHGACVWDATVIAQGRPAGAEAYA